MSKSCFVVFLCSAYWVSASLANKKPRASESGISARNGNSSQKSGELFKSRWQQWNLERRFSTRWSDKKHRGILKDQLMMWRYIKLYPWGENSAEWSQQAQGSQVKVIFFAVCVTLSIDSKEDFLNATWVNPEKVSFSLIKTFCGKTTKTVSLYYR